MKMTQQFFNYYYFKQSLNKSLIVLTKPKAGRFIQKLLKLNLLGLALCPTAPFAFEYGDPTHLEQAHLELINRARANPLKEAQRNNIDLFEGISNGALANSNPVQPLSSNVLLLKIARNHSLDMLQNNYFEHNDLSGKSPFNRMTDIGYSIQAAGENIGWQGTTGNLDQTSTALSLHGNLFIDKDVAGRGHRINILSPNFREVGVGLGFGVFTQSGRQYNSGLVTTDFGTRSNKPLVLGVVYEDKNADQFYSAGEGIANVNVAISATNSTQTATAGGYGLEVNPNTNYTIIFTHPTYGTVSKTIQVDSLNVKVDIVRTDFNSTNANTAQCAILSQNQLSIPCITVAGSNYKAALTISNNAPLQFALQSSVVSKQSATAQCGTYNSQTNTAHLNCVTVGNTRYWADLQLTGSVFALGSYGVLP